MKIINRRTLLIILASLLLVLGTWYVYGRLISDSTVERQTDGNINYSPPTDEEKKKSEENKLDQIENAPTGERINNEVYIENIFQDSESKQVIIQTKLLGLDWSNCEVKLTNGTITVSRTAKTLYQQDFSTCIGFAIDGTEFSPKGEWTAVLSATTLDGKVLNSDEKRISVEL
jgi:hypothetical protein